MSPESFGLKIKNVKCFGDSEQGFSEIKPINIIIGRNNSGKSTLLDALEFAVSPNSISLIAHQEANPEVLISLKIATSSPFHELPDGRQQVTHASLTKSYVPRDWAATRLRDRTIVVRQTSSCRCEFVRFDDVEYPDEWDAKIAANVGTHLASAMENPLTELGVVRLAADRDIIPEKSIGNVDVSRNGKNLTNIVFQCQNVKRFDESRVNIDLLNAINEVCYPDSEFTKVSAKMSEMASDELEIHFEEPQKGRLPVSHLGSGLKTVTAVMIYLHIVPFVPEIRRPLSRFIFAFEELENNLHPSMQRRLFGYLRRFALKHHCRFFVTTHSNAVIDMFANDPQAQILHVTHDRRTSRVTKLETYGDAARVLDDLGLHASDILQANAILWVEGPSDRIYLRKWIEIISNGELQDGIHYQCVPFGGSLNAHLSFDDPEQMDQLVSLLRVNRHAVLLIDSDREIEGSPLKKHTERLQRELDEQGGIAWITGGREVENYIPQRLWVSLFDGNPADYPGKFASILHTLNATTSARKKFTKVELAHELSHHLTREDIESTLDLARNLAKICEKIREWNGLVTQ